MVCLLIAAVSAMVLALREMALRRRIRCAQKTADGSFLLALSGLFARVAIADGTATADEVGTVERIFSEMGLTDAEKAMCIGNFVLVHRGKSAVCERVTKLAASLNKDARLLLFGLLWRVANADGRLAAEEERMLGEIGEELGLGADVVSRFRREGLPPLGEKTLDEAGVPLALIREIRM